MSDELKVFILGSPRSGTSIMYYAMREVFALPGRGESHVFPVFGRMLHQFYTYVTDFSQNHRGVLAGELDVRTLRQAFQTYLRNFYDRAYGAGGFVDKTPGAETIRASSLIYGAFPNARVILLQRNGIEVVGSYQSKFGAPFEASCQSWAQVVTASQRLLQERPDVLVVDQFDLTNSPEKVGDRIATHLQRPNLAGQLASFFVERRVEQSSTHDWSRRLTFTDVNWSDEQKLFFKSVCGESMVQLGYAF